ncbi:ankyrin repeat protein [Paraburkholderia sp. BL17N1]|nr:ankyrin repeat protein [Paraburkholderia sp. BL17N1]
MRYTQLKTKVGAELRTAEAADPTLIESLPEGTRETVREKLTTIREQQRANLDDAPQPTIFAAASLGDPRLLAELVRHFDPRLADCDGWTPLMAAAMATRFAREDDAHEASSSVQCLKLLLPLSDPQARSSSGMTALMLAGSAQAVNILLPVSDPKAVDDRRRTALMHVALRNWPSAAVALVGVSNVNAESEDGATALDYALGVADDRVKVQIVQLLAPLTTVGIDKSLELALAAAMSKRADDAAGRNAWRSIIDELASRASRAAAKAALDQFRVIDFPRASAVLANRPRD